MTASQPSVEGGRTEMPEEVVLRCDAPGCDEVGDYCTITCGGKSVEVILGPKHRELLKEVSSWGRPARRASGAGPRGKRRVTDERRLLTLLDADKR